MTQQPTSNAPERITAQMLLDQLKFTLEIPENKEYSVLQTLKTAIVNANADGRDGRANTVTLPVERPCSACGEGVTRCDCKCVFPVVPPPRVKLIPLESTWTCPNCERQNVYREGLASDPQNECFSCRFKVQIGANRNIDSVPVVPEGEGEKAAGDVVIGCAIDRPLVIQNTSRNISQEPEPQSDLQEILDKCDFLASKAIQTPWFVGFDDAKDAQDHTDSGLALIDTGRSADWPVARLCEWPTAEFIAYIGNNWPIFSSNLRKLLTATPSFGVWQGD